MSSSDGNFIIGAQACKNAPPDGYTICMFSIAAMPPLMFDNWFGLFAPAGTPPERIAFLSRELMAMVRDPAIRERYIEGLGFAATGNSAEEFKSSLPAYRDHAGELVRLSGIARAADLNPYGALGEQNRFRQYRPIGRSHPRPSIPAIRAAPAA